MADIVIVNPRFDISFWGLEHCMPLFGKKANLPVACLGLLAALVPDHHDVTLVDENVEDIDFDRLARADLVCLTGMNIQGRRLIEILEEVRARGAMTVVGGPMATVEPEALEGLADVIFVGEADETWPEFLAAWEKGEHKSRYVQPEKTDVTTLPVPRTDLLKIERYMFGSMQISRGCPFTCEFCDIIVTFGRRPRLKTSEQVIAELEDFLRAGFKIVFVVDDNLIGNKKAIKPILRDIARWQQERAYPLTLFTEASLDLAEDDELMELMGLANFQNVFIGIETPNEESLRETKKLQNVRPNAGSLIDRVHRIQDSGIDVWCGMIVGFDHDDPSIFKTVPAFLSRARISTALVGLLHAIPTTPLYKRLKGEDRLNDEKNADRYGTNVIPLGMSSAELRDGFIQTMKDCYTVDAYFDRLDSQFIEQNFKFTLHELPYWSKWRMAWAKRAFFNYVRFAVVASRLLSLVQDEDLRARYRKQLVQITKLRWREPHILFIYALKTATHYHYAELVRAIGDVDPETGAMSEAGRPFSRSRKAETDEAIAA
ncbi:MAG: B12-binding domain-containing radical SAM protein [Hyphomicrobiaceae bacterium]|nr:B12-binding domain-containing radical SAM protein [Hyphomicrobiaceae bacterium]